MLGGSISGWGASSHDLSQNGTSPDEGTIPQAVGAVITLGGDLVQTPTSNGMPDARPFRDKVVLCRQKSGVEANSGRIPGSLRFPE